MFWLLVLDHQDFRVHWQQQRMVQELFLAEDKPRFGGSLLTDEVTIGNKKGEEWVDDVISELKSMPNVIVQKAGHKFLVIMIIICWLCLKEQRDHLQNPAKFTPRDKSFGTYVQKKSLFQLALLNVLSSLANNDKPGIMLASAAKEYLKVYGVVVGKKPLIFTNNDSAYETAIEFKNNGIHSLVVDVRHQVFFR